jgi:DNA-binding response OmpR family regulator
MTKHVLILDDNADNRKLLYYALMPHNYDIHEAALGRDVLRLLDQKTDIDLALLDIELPDIDGLDVAEKLRQRFPDIVLIMLSANDNSDRLNRARKVGVHAYAVKPFNLRNILDFIRAFDDNALQPDMDMQVL